MDIPVRVRLGLVARKGGGLPAQNAFVTKLDAAQQIMQLSYFTDLARPSEDVRIDGVPIRPVYAKTTAIRFFGETWLYQRDVWVPSTRPISVRVSGKLMPIVYGPPAARCSRHHLGTCGRGTQVAVTENSQLPRVRARTWCGCQPSSSLPSASSPVV